jgi:hypothetical protein
MYVVLEEVAQPASPPQPCRHWLRGMHVGIAACTLRGAVPIRGLCITRGFRGAAARKEGRENEADKAEERRGGSHANGSTSTSDATLRY